uniref:Uncharacterized protein n=1 Tax=Meloidogyne enterolobii TaxID=390850 RepID=A0A6V7VZX3_MELEN|nr:unnamed protein product [Meloidogyne enterolobii]
MSSSSSFSSPSVKISSKNSINFIILFIFFSGILLFTPSINAKPLLSVGQNNNHINEEKKFNEPPTFRGFAPQTPFLMPYASGNGFVSPFPSGMGDRWAGFLADQQFGGGAIKRTSDGHFMEPAGWLALEEPGRFEWNFNRL